MPPTHPITLTDEEIAQLCPGLTQPAAIRRQLIEWGFTRARVVEGRVHLERHHYEAVCRGEFAAGRNRGYHAPEVDLTGLRP